MTTSTLILLVAVAFATLVEVVEAMTIVLAAGITRGWRSTFEGSAAALGLLIAVVIILGPALINYVPINILRLVVGCLLLIMGLQWVCKGLLRSSGFKSIHDEALHYRDAVQTLSNNPRVDNNKKDSLAFALSFKAVLLEGAEVIIIVISFGVQSGQLLLCSLSAIVTTLVVGSSGFVIAKPLTKVPENFLKLTVGLILLTFGTFWMGEGAGIEWLGSDAYLLILLASFILAALIIVNFMRRQNRRSSSGGKTRKA
jgi:uncharacterized membrane protein